MAICEKQRMSCVNVSQSVPRVPPPDCAGGLSQSTAATTLIRNFLRRGRHLHRLETRHADEETTFH